MPKKRKSIYTPGDFKLKVRRSKTGNGLYAEEDIPKDVCVIEYVGRPITEDEADAKQGRYYFTVGKNKTIDGNIKGNPAKYINHSCRPNCEAIGPSGKVYIFSMRRIKAGEELTYDYGKEYFDDFLKGKCACPKCAEKRKK